MSVRAVVFDLDGTLIELNELMPKGMTLTMERFGLEVRLDKKEMSGKTDKEIFLFFLRENNWPENQLQSAAEELIMLGVRIIPELIPQYGVRPCPGVPELLSDLKQTQIAVGLLTGNMQGIVEAKLLAAGFDPAQFSFGAFGNESDRRGELAELAIQRAADRLGESLHAEEVLIVGDTPNDINCARMAGARSLAVATGAYTLEELAIFEPDFQMKGLEDRDRFLGLLEPRSHSGSTWAAQLRSKRE